MICRAVILAAGRAQGFDERPAALHEVLGEPLLGLALELARRVGAGSVTVVTGPRAGVVRERFAGVPDLVVQDAPLGAEGARRAAREAVARDPETPLLILDADRPLVRPESVARLLAEHRRERAAVSLLTAGAGGGPADERGVAAWIFAAERLLTAPEPPPGDASAHHGALRALVERLAAAGGAVHEVAVGGADEMLRVESLADCAAATRVLRRRVLDRLMASGVVVEDPETTWVGPGVRVEPDAVLRSQTRLEGACRVGAGADLGPSVRLRDVEVGAGARILDHCLLQECRVGAGAQVGPFSHVRPGSDVGEDARVGNFVELKKTRLGAGAKASHLSYLGDAEIGRDVNIGAGTITCNYDGVAKHPTRIGEGAFVGSHSTLVAPIEIGAGAFTAAGSTLTEDVEPEALALGRARQTVKPGWARRRRERSCE